MDQPSKLETNKELHERMLALPQVVREAITSAEMEKHLREMSVRHKLHIDQWEVLETEIFLTVLGIESSDNLTANIQTNLGITHEAAVALAQDVSSEVFEPIRKQLEASVAAEEPLPVNEPIEPNQLTNEKQPEVYAPKVVEPPPPAATPLEKQISHLEGTSVQTKTPTAAPAAIDETPKVKRGTLDAAPAVPNAAQKREIDPYREPLV